MVDGFRLSTLSRVDYNQLSKTERINLRADFMKDKDYQVSCDYCNIKLERTPAIVLRNKRHFCSKTCHNRSKVGQPLTFIRFDMTGRTPWIKGRHHSEETKRKISRSETGIKRSEETKRKLRLARMNRVFPFKDSSIEVKLQKYLTEAGLVYSKHYPIFGQPDIAFPDKKIAIFADGDYWHNRDCAKIRDKDVNRTLSNEGWTVLRYWEHEINNDIEQVIDEINYKVN